MSAPNLNSIIATVHAAVTASPTFTGITAQCDNSATFAPKKPTTLVEGMVHAVATALDHADMKFLAAEKLGPHWPDVAAEAIEAGLLTPRCRLTPLGREMAESNGWLPANPNPNPNPNPPETNMPTEPTTTTDINLTVPCPRCEAAVGVECTWGVTRSAGDVHAARRKAAAKAAAEATEEATLVACPGCEEMPETCTCGDVVDVPAMPFAEEVIAAVEAPAPAPVTRTLAEAKAYATSVQTTEDHCTDGENLRALATLAAMVLAIPDAPDAPEPKARKARKARAPKVALPYPNSKDTTIGALVANPDGTWRHFTRNGRDVHRIVSVSDRGAITTSLYQTASGACVTRRWPARDAALVCTAVDPSPDASLALDREYGATPANVETIPGLAELGL